MRVEKWMTPRVVTIGPDDSLAAAIRLMKEKKVRRLPVVSKGKLVGIVSDRDLKEVTPSKATTLDVWELHTVLDRLKIADVMAKKVASTTPESTIERAALTMMEKKIEGLPVLDAKGNLVGILTEGDVFRALVEITGVAKKKTRVSLVIPDEAGTIRQVADVCRKQGGKIFSILTSYAKVPAGKRELIMRIDCPSTEALRAELAQKFGDVVVEQD
jgi:acetoin utilization protein AcuB